MIRLSWRQFRFQGIGAAVVLGCLAIALAITGPMLVHDFHTSGAALCASAGDCSPVAQEFTNTFKTLQIVVNAAIYVVPALIGMFWGAPLVARELETGTYRLAWTQGLSRTRWLVAKFVFVGLIATAVAGLLALMVTWWSSPLDAVFNNRMTPAVFGERGVVPLGYGAMAFALGVTAGTMIRRTVPAMAAALASFVGLRLALTYWVRPHLFTPVVRVVGQFTGLVQPGVTGPPLGSWVFSNETVNRAGRVIASGGGLSFSGTPRRIVIPGAGVCHLPASASQPGQVIATCAHRLGIHQVMTYLPPSRFWPLQGIETVICLAIAALLGAASVWWVRHRIV